MPYQAISIVTNNALGLLAARATAMNMGCEHLIENDRDHSPQNAQRVLWCLWDGLACDMCNEEKALKYILVEFNQQLRNIKKELDIGK